MLDRRELLQRVGTVGIAGLGGIASIGSATEYSPLPLDYYSEYRLAARQYGLDWAHLAGIGDLESSHGKDTDGCKTSSSGARGPMQFEPDRWDAYGIDGDDDGVADVCNYKDAIPSLARFLKYNGAQNDLHAALYEYENDWKYVEAVVDAAEHYRGSIGDNNPVWPICASGDQGEIVYTIQYLLEHHGYPVQYHDGVFGSDVEDSVEQFQSPRGLTVNGIVGPDTWQMLIAIIDETNSPYWATYALQRQLKNDEGYDIPVTGSYDIETRAAVEDFQSENDLTVDGIVDQPTWRALVNSGYDE